MRVDKQGLKSAIRMKHLTHERSPRATRNMVSEHFVMRAVG